MTDEQKLFQWMLDIQACIAADPVCGIVPTTTEYPTVRSVGNTWAQTVSSWFSYLTGGGDPTATQIGLATFITFPHTEGESNKLGSITTEIVAEISVAESLVANAFVAPQGTSVNGFAPGGLGVHCDDYAASLMMLLENWSDGTVAAAARCRDFRKDSDIWIPPDMRVGTVGDLRVCGFQIHAMFTLNVPTKCFPPLISIAGGNATITCNTPGAAILYSVGDTFPFAAPTATYSAPVAVTTGQTIKAVATKTGLKNSSFADAVAS